MNSDEKPAGRAYTGLGSRGLYDHILDSDQRYQAAASTSQKSGAAFQGGDAFLAPSPNWRLIIPAFLALTGFVLWWVRS